MRIFLISILFLTTVSCWESTVYVCDSRNAKRYHLKENCRGLSNCSYQIIEISLDKAKKDGKTLCHWED
jgi:5-bromo-4-chloroindolyl phosphate hydrolysis protein